MAEEGADILDAVIFGVISASLRFVNGSSMGTSSFGPGPKEAWKLILVLCTAHDCSVLLQPLDRLKTLTQQDAAASANPTRYFSKVVRTHGFLDLWRGTSPTLLRAVPGITLYFGFLQLGKNAMPQLSNAHIANFLLGSCSRTAATLLLMPATVIKTRFETLLRAVPGITLYFGFLQLGKNAMPQLSNAHIANFLLGSCSRTAATLLLMPATVIKTRFESSLYRDAGIKKAAKELFHQYGWRDHTSHAPVERFGSGLIAGLCACAITQPFDMIKTHVQLFSQHSLYEFISLLYQVNLCYHKIIAAAVAASSVLHDSSVDRNGAHPNSRNNGFESLYVIFSENRL
ncbi:unnamed protein product [Gongylonema pulchrum]|uniref:Solute carrier family 25 member 38 n=1 Tax=Gongylonema pulchrum TaxID=637853 RepID=A0A183DUH9_9BILA|nr:unnamed protein product [Gongylonema pulchrum]